MGLESYYQIKNNPIVYSYLREDSYQYKYLYRDPDYIKVIEAMAKERYQLRSVDRIEKLSNNLDLIRTFMDVFQ